MTIVFALVRTVVPVLALLLVGNAVAQVTTGPPSMAAPAPPLSPAPGWYVNPQNNGPLPPLTRNPNVFAPVGVGPLNAFVPPATVSAPPSTGPMPPLTRNPQATAPVVSGWINPFVPPPGW
jgi:hypothetical protein